MDERALILDTAENLFASEGVSGTSLARIAEVSRVAIEDHFASKDSLLDALVERRVRPLNAARIVALDRVLAQAGESPPAVENVLEAFLLPGVRELQSIGARRARSELVMARIEAQSPALVESLRRKHFGEVGQRFVSALQRALPGVPKEIVADRFRVGLGCGLHLFGGRFDLDPLPGSPAHAKSPTAAVESLVPFLAAGLRADVPGAPRAG